MILPQPEQQKAFIYFEALRNSRALFTIQTPFRYYTDMAIESIRATQSGFSRDQSDFEISFKKMRFVDVDKKILSDKQWKALANDEQGRLAEQSAAIEQMGIASTNPVAETAASVFEYIGSGK